MQVNILEAKNRLSQLVRAVQTGDEVVIANRGEPAVRLVAIRSAACHRGSAACFLGWLQRTPLPAHLQRGHEAIEAAICAERAAWD